jgi:hypothetical protein
MVAGGLAGLTVPVLGIPAVLSLVALGAVIFVRKVRWTRIVLLFPLLIGVGAGGLSRQVDGHSWSSGVDVLIAVASVGLCLLIVWRDEKGSPPPTDTINAA